MAFTFLKNGQTSVIVRVKLRDSSSSVGAGLTGLTSASSGLRISTIADNEATATAYTVAGSTIESITTLGTFAAPTATKCRFKEVDSTSHPGLYEVQIADARWAVSNAKAIVISISGATNLVQTDKEVQLTSVDPYDAVRFALTALPNAAAGANGGLPLGDASGRTDVGRWLGTAVTLTSGVPDVNIKTITAGIIAAASFASGALDAVWSTTTRTLSTGAIVAGTFAANALDAVWSTTTRLLTAGTNIVLAKGVGVTGFNDLSAAQVNTEADTALSDVGLTGTVTGRIDVAVSTRLASASYTAPPSAATIAAAVWDYLTSTATTVGSLGKLLVDNINATISSRSSHSAADVWAAGTRSLTTFGTLVADVATAVWASVTRTLTGIADANVTQIDGLATSGNNATLNLKQLNIVNDAGAGLVAVGTTAGTSISGVDGGMGVYLEGSGVNPAVFLQSPGDGIDAKNGVSGVGFRGDITGDITGAISGSVTVGTNNDKTGYALTPGERSSIADQVWEETLADHSGTVGSTAAAMNAAGGAGDPWATAVPGAYGAGTAGKILGDNLNATVSSRLATAGYTAPDNADILLIKARTDNLPSDPADASDIATATTAISNAIAALNNLSQANVRTALGLASANLDTQLDALPTNAELATALGTADDATLAAIAALNNLSSGQVATAIAAALAATVPDTMPALGDRPSVNQAAYLVFQYLLDRIVVGTTQTIHKPDGTTALATSTLDNATAPTSLTRAS